MENKWDRKLKEQKRLDSIFEDLKKRAVKVPRFLYSAAVYPQLTLHWTISHQDLVTREIISACSNPEYKLDVIKHSVVVLDKKRDFYISAWPERILLMNMAKILAEETNHLITECVYSFRKGRGTITALSDLSNYIKRNRKSGTRSFFVLKRDITKYGDTIPHSSLIDFLVKKTIAGQNPKFMNLLTQSLRSHYKNLDGTENCMVRGVPSGSPLVPPLENLYLTPLDDKLRAIPNSFYGRYGDDFIFITPHRNIADNVKDLIDEQVKELGLTIKPEKKQDIYLSIQTSPSVPKIMGYETLVGFEWLGARLSARGDRSLRNKHKTLLWKLLRSEVKSLLSTARSMKVSDELRIDIVRKGISKLISKSDSHQVSSLIYGHASPESLKQFDHGFVTFLQRSIEKEWAIGRKASWKVLKTIAPPKTFFQQFMEVQTESVDSKIETVNSERAA